MEWRCKPDIIRSDNRPEYLSNQLVTWVIKHNITLMYILPGKPKQNAYIERFNRTARYGWLDMHKFDSVAHAQDVATN